MDRGKDDTGGKVLKQIADLHIHSRYSMATSKDGTPEMLDLWARKKGITLLGTGDMTHPIWRQELKAKLIPAEQGLFRLKDEYVLPEAARYPGKAPRFVLSGEISSIYKKGGKTRKVHSLILLPGFNEADAFAARLEKIGNIHSDGRPILGLPCHDLLELMLEVIVKLPTAPENDAGLPDGNGWTSIVTGGVVNSFFTSI